MSANVSRAALPDHGRNEDRAADGADREARPHVVFLIHGIRTRAEWAEGVAAQMQQQGLLVKPLGYGYFDLIRFLSPFSGPKIQVARSLASAMRSHLFAGHRKSVVAHSFGTYLFATILSHEPDLYFERAVLCGSVVREDFNWELFAGRLAPATIQRPAIVNDCGYRDPWPVFARLLSSDFGASGRFGFRAPGVLDRFHALRHGDFFEKDFVREFWSEFIASGVARPGDTSRPSTPWWLSILGAIRLPFATLLAAILLGLVWFGYRAIVPPYEVFTTVDCYRPDHTCRVDVAVHNPTNDGLFINSAEIAGAVVRRESISGAITPTATFATDISNLSTDESVTVEPIDFEIKPHATEKFTIVVGAKSLPDDQVTQWSAVIHLHAGRYTLETKELKLALPWNWWEHKAPPRVSSVKGGY